MSTGDHLQVVCVVVLLSDVLPEGIASASGIHAPACPVIGVRPQQVAHGAFVGHLLESFEGSDVVEGLDAGGESSVETEELVFYDCCEGDVVEEFSEASPDI